MTENQETLLTLIPDWFEGTLNEKLVYGVFMHCNNCAVNRGEDRFTLGYNTIMNETGLSRATCSKIVNKFVEEGLVNRLMVGSNFGSKNSTYSVSEHMDRHMVDICRHMDRHMVDICRHMDRHMEKSEHMDRHMVDISRHMDRHMTDSCESGSYEGEHMVKNDDNAPYVYPELDTKYNYNIIIDKLLTLERTVDRYISVKIQKLEERLDSAAKYMKQLESRISQLEEKDKDSSISSSSLSISSSPKRKGSSIDLKALTDKLKDKTLPNEDRCLVRDELTGYINDSKLTEKQKQWVDREIADFKREYNSLSSTLNLDPSPKHAATPSPNVMSKEVVSVGRHWYELYRTYRDKQYLDAEWADDMKKTSDKLSEMIKKNQVCEKWKEGFNNVWTWNDGNGNSSPMALEVRTILNKKNKVKETEIEYGKNHEDETHQEREREGITANPELSAA